MRSFDLDYRPAAVVNSAQDMKIDLGYDAVGNVAALTSKDYPAALAHDALGGMGSSG